MADEKETEVICEDEACGEMSNDSVGSVLWFEDDGDSGFYHKKCWDKWVEKRMNMTEESVLKEYYENSITLEEGEM